MGRKGTIGRRPKSGTQGSIDAVSSRKALKPNEVRADVYRYGTAQKRTTREKRRLDPTSLEDDSDDAANDEANNQPRLKLKAVVVGNERFLFGDDDCSTDNKRDSILRAILESGKTAEEKVSALVLAMSDAGLHQLVDEFLKKNQVMTPATSTGMSPCSPEATVSSPLNPNVLFPTPPINQVAVAVDGLASVEVLASTPPQEFQTRNDNQSESTLINKQRSRKRKERVRLSAPMDPLENDAFEYKRNGARRKNISGKSGQMAKSRQITRIRNAILDSSLNQSQQILALHEAANHPSLRSIMKSAGLIRPMADEVAMYHEEQRKRLFTLARGTQRKEGQTSNDRRSFVESNLVACADSPELGEQTKRPSKLQRIESLGLPISTGYRLFKKAEEKRKHIHMNDEERTVSWSRVKARKGYTKVSQELRKQLYEWVLDHPHVVNSPISNDTIIIKDNNNEKTRVGKLLLQISIRELHNDLLSDGPLGLPGAKDTAGEPIISDTALRSLLPPQLKRMSTKYKAMCGCELCIIMGQFQASLNAYRLSLLRRLEKETDECDSQEEKAIKRTRSDNYREAVYPDSQHWHPKPKDALSAIQCPNVEGFNFPEMKCILRTCRLCPKYILLREERLLTDDDTPIAFHVYHKFSRCRIHGILDDGVKECQLCSSLRTLNANRKPGKFSERKHLTLLKRRLSVFFTDHYLPLLEKYAYHRAHFVLLGKFETGALRKLALGPGDAETTRDYAERLTFEFTQEIMSQHFGDSRDMSLEGSTARTFKAEDIESFQQGLLVELTQSDTTMDFHSHFSDDNLQNAAASHCHMRVLIEHLRKNGRFLKGHTMFDNTDGCAKQYRCATAIHLLSMLAVEFNMAINRSVGAPGHGKDLVDGLNACDKQYLKKMMMRITLPGNEQSAAGEDKKIIPYSVKEREFASIAEEAARLCALDRSGGAKGDKKHKKREEAATMKNRIYHVRKREDVVQEGLKMKLTGLPKKGAHVGLLGRYNLHVDADLGVGTAALRRIPCACAACEEHRKRPWKPGFQPKDQPRFQQNKACKYWPIFKGENDWLIVKTSASNDVDPMDIEQSQKEVLGGIMTRMAEEIEDGKYGAVMTEDDNTHGYYLVRWASETYAAQEDTDEWASGELVCDAAYLNPVGRARNWYTPGDDRVTIRVQHVVAAALVLEEPSDAVKLPSTCNRKDALSKGAKRLSDDCHLTILDEINRRDILDYEENEDSSSDDDSSVEQSEEESSDKSLSSDGEGGVSDEE
jgi:hypothetical protein